MRFPLSIVAVVVTTLAIGSAACAEDGFSKRLFAGDVETQDKPYACFLRRYDAAHLSRHPRQKVSAMKLLVTADKMPEDETLNYSFRLGVKFQWSSGRFRLEWGLRTRQGVRLG